MISEIWTDDRVTTLKDLWAKGLSCSQIARELACFSHCADGGRSAVIGKIHRLKLPAPNGKSQRPIVRRARAPRSAPTTTPPAKQRAAVAAIPPPPVLRQKPGKISAPIAAPFSFQRKRNPTGDVDVQREIDAAEPGIDEAVTGLPTGKGVKFAALTPFNCRWPLGDVGEPDFEFCGHAINGGGPYCGPHTRMAYQTPAARQRQTKWALLGAEQKS